MKFTNQKRVYFLICTFILRRLITPSSSHCVLHHTIILIEIHHYFTCIDDQFDDKFDQVPFTGQYTTKHYCPPGLLFDYEEEKKGHDSTLQELERVRDELEITSTELSSKLSDAEKVYSVLQGSETDLRGKLENELNRGKVLDRNRADRIRKH